MNEIQIKQFFARKEKAPNKVRMNFKKFSLNNLPVETQLLVKKRLAEKDEVMALGQKGILVGIKIDGKQVTRDNIKDFEIEKMSEPRVKEKPKEVKKVEEKVEVKIKYIRSDLEKLSFSKLKKIAETLGETGRSRTGLIKDILKHN